MVNMEGLVNLQGQLFLLMFLGLFCFEFLPGPMLRLFSRDALVISIGSYGFRWIGLSFLPQVTSLIFPVFFQAVGYAGKSSLLTILRTVVLFVPLGWALSLLGLRAFWLTYPITEVVTSLVGFGFYRQFLRRDVQEDQILFVASDHTAAAPVPSEGHEFSKQPGGEEAGIAPDTVMAESRDFVRMGPP